MNTESPSNNVGPALPRQPNRKQRRAMGSVVRRQKKEIGKRKSAVAYCYGKVLEFFKGDQTKTELWFKTSNPLLGNVSPIDMVRLGRFAKLVHFVETSLAENEAPPHA